MKQAEVHARAVAYRQRIITLIAQSQTRAQIASVIGITVHTVDWHMDQIKKQLGFSDPAALALYAVRMGWFPQYEFRGKSPIATRR